MRMVTRLLERELVDRVMATGDISPCNWDFAANIIGICIKDICVWSDKLDDTGYFSEVLTRVSVTLRRNKVKLEPLFLGLGNHLPLNSNQLVEARNQNRERAIRQLEIDLVMRINNIENMCIDYWDFAFDIIRICSRWIKTLNNRVNATPLIFEVLNEVSVCLSRRARRIW